MSKYDLLDYQLVFRGITNSTNRRTAIVSLVPGHVALGDSCARIDIDVWMRTGKIEFERSEQHTETIQHKVDAPSP